MKTVFTAIKVMVGKLGPWLDLLQFTEEAIEAVSAWTPLNDVAWLNGWVATGFVVAILLCLIIPFLWRKWYGRGGEDHD